MGVLLTIIGYVIVLAATFEIVMLKPQGTAGRGFAAVLGALVVLVIVNTFMFLGSKHFANPPDITAGQVAMQVYGLEEGEQIPLLLAAPGDNPASKGVVFTLDPQHPLASNGKLLVRVSFNEKSYEWELPPTVNQKSGVQASIQLEFKTPESRDGGIYGQQTLVSDPPCTVRLIGVFWCEKERKYETHFPKKVYALDLFKFLEDTLTSATFTVPPDVYRAIKLG